ncbi:MAG: c-type cytochrome [Boseongicola sp.]
MNTRDGRDLYMTYCWQCHGRDATGNGPMAEMLAITTPDLTGLAARNDGVFPTEAVARQIDGRARMLAHGGEMPIFGPSLESDQNVALPLLSGQPLMTGLPLANVITYLEALQAK